MGLLGDEENQNDSSSSETVDLSEVATQQIDDSQDSPGGALEGEDPNDFLYISNAMPFDDTYQWEDAFETQLVDLAGETQVVDLAGETQVLDDLDCLKNMEVEFLNDFNAEVEAVSRCEGTNKTEALCETQELSQDGSVKIDGSDSAGLESTPRKGDSGSGAPTDTYTNEEHHSGSISRGFTSIRVASVRASGLAARAHGANGSLRTSSSDKSSIELQRCGQDDSSFVGTLLKSGSKDDLDCLQNEYNEDSKEQRNLNKCQVMRKLFGEDKVAEVGLSEANLNHTGDNFDMPELPTSENCLAGLSYANSQEPGELSQYYALEVVDKFLDLNVMERHEHLGKRSCNAEKPNILSGAKGSLNLAKSSILKSMDRDHGIYDWDNTHEDDGGGDFFLKKKELFFGEGGSKQRCLTKPRKPGCPDVESVESLGNNRDKKGQNHMKSKSGDAVLHKLRTKGKSLNCLEEIFQKNLVKNLDEKNRVCGPELAENDSHKDIPDMNNIGPDTQMAAEAMETLCFELHLPDSSDNDTNNGTHGAEKATREYQTSNRTARSEHLTTKMPSPTSDGVTRQAEQKKRAISNTSHEFSLLPKQSKKLRKRRDTELGEVEHSRLAESNVSPYHERESTGQTSAMMSHCKEPHDVSIPVAHRTRKSKELNPPKAAPNSFDAEEEINDLVSAHVLRKRRTVAKQKNVEIVTIEKLKKMGSAAFKQLNKKCAGTSSASNVAAVCNQQGKRSRQGKLIVGPESDTKYSGKLKRPRELEKSNADTPAEGAKTNSRLEASPREKCETSTSACGTPASGATPVNNVSPICMGDEYHKQSCRKNLSKFSLIKEINSLATGSPGPFGGMKDLRKRKDITNVRVLFSQHLDEDVVRQQKKMLSRLGGAIASSMSDATHFVADEFVRTRNMLEAIACGKPVVTHLWLESCGQASCLIDEKNYVLRDARKEREFGFSLPVSLSRACQHPLLQGQKVLVTPNTKPGKDILANLVKAVHGLAIARLGRSALKDEKLPDDLLILSCEEDYDVCVPFLEKGGAVYSSELLLNGIVKQKLEYERYRLFNDHFKRTRSTKWVKKKNQYLPATKSK